MNEKILDILKSKLGQVEKKLPVTLDISCPFVDELAPHQKEVFDDPNRWKALLWGRRSGKSYAAAIKLLYTAITRPERTSLYIAQTNQSAYEILWGILKDYDDRYTLGCVFNETNHNVRFSNGSEIRVRGCSNGIQADRFRGGKYEVIIIDEASMGSFKDNLEYLLDEALGMALEDVEGVEVWLCSTPNRECVGHFYDITTSPSEYKVFHSTVFENPYLDRWSGKKNWKELSLIWFQEWLKKKDLKESDNKVQREVFARNVKDTDLFILNLDRDKNTYSELPLGDIRRIISIDLGWEDPMAFMVAGYSPFSEHPELYIEFLHRESYLNTDDAIVMLKKLIDTYKPIRIVCDTGGGGKRFQEDFNAKYYLNMQVEPAIKTDKVKYLDLLSSDCRAGKILINRKYRDEFDELRQLTYLDKDKGLVRTTKTLRDEYLDTLNYLYREYLKFAYTTRTKKPVLSIEQQMEQKIIDRSLKEEKARKRMGLRRI